MTNPTDPRVEAAARAILRTDDPWREWDKESDWLRGAMTDLAIAALKAADAAAWLPIETAPGNVCVIAGHPDYVFPAFRDDLFSEEHNLGLFFSNSGGLQFGPIDPQPTHWQPLPKTP